MINRAYEGISPYNTTMPIYGINIEQAIPKKRCLQQIMTGKLYKPTRSGAFGIEI